jgi:hypothetical protein
MATQDSNSLTAFQRECAEVQRGSAMGKRLGHCLWTFLVLAGMVLFLPGCEQKTIKHILVDPHRYATQEVGVVGKVVRSYSVLGHGAYEVDDGTGTLWVVSTNGVPREGARVGVKGTIRDGFSLGELGTILKLPEPVRSGVVMMESERKVKQ